LETDSGSNAIGMRYQTFYIPLQIMLRIWIGDDACMMHDVCHCLGRDERKVGCRRSLENSEWFLGGNAKSLSSPDDRNASVNRVEKGMSEGTELANSKVVL
jgi:hypothetical protein